MRIILAILIFFLCSVILVSCDASQGDFIIVNKASENISHAQILISGKKIEFNEIDVGAQVQAHYKVLRDSHYEIRIHFDSGREIVNDIGYVTPGVNFHHEIIVEDSGVWISKSEIK